MNVTHIIVYGTLMVGQRAHQILSKCEFEGTINIPGRMYDLVGFPGVKLGGPDDPTFRAELYSLPKHHLPRRATLTALDRYEGEGSLYTRKAILVTHGGRNVAAYIYEVNGSFPDEDLVDGGDWLAHDQKVASG